MSDVVSPVLVGREREHPRHDEAEVAGLVGDVGDATQPLARVPGDRERRRRDDVPRRGPRRHDPCAAGAGADAVLIGTALSRAADPAALLRELAGVPRRGR